MAGHFNTVTGDIAFRPIVGSSGILIIEAPLANLRKISQMLRHDVELGRDVHIYMLTVSASSGNMLTISTL